MSNIKVPRPKSQKSRIWVFALVSFMIAFLVALDQYLKYHVWFEAKDFHHEDVIIMLMFAGIIILLFYYYVKKR